MIVYNPFFPCCSKGACHDERRRRKARYEEEREIRDQEKSEDTGPEGLGGESCGSAASQELTDGELKTLPGREARRVAGCERAHTKNWVRRLSAAVVSRSAVEP